METKQPNYLPTKPINTLPEREWYPIYKSKSTQTKYGRAILVWLYDLRSYERFKVFLPSAVCKKIPDDNPISIDDREYRGDIIPSSVGQLPHFKMAYYGRKL